MSKISITYPESWLNPSISIINRTTEVEAFNWIMTEVWTTKVYIYEFTEIANTDYVYVITTTWYDSVSDSLFYSSTTAPTVSQIANAVWDEPLTGATHNVPTSAWRRLRQLWQVIVYDWIAQGSWTWDNQIQLDTWAANHDGAYDPTEIAIVLGTWVWQSRMILDYVGSTRMATVDRNWKIKPDATSEFIIYVNSWREHVNEGLAQGGTDNTIILNSSASDITDSYVWQNVFIRSWTGQDQVARVTAYNGTTKVATIETAMASWTWWIIPDTTSGYVMLPYHAVANGGGWLTEAQNKHLMKLRNWGGGALINFESIEKWLSKDREWLYKKIEEIPWIVKESEENVIESIWIVNNWISYIIESNEIETLSDKIDKIDSKNDEIIKLSKEQAQEGKHKVEKLSHTIETYRLEDEIKEETKELEQLHEVKIETEVKELETEIQIQDEVQRLALEAQIQEEIKLLSNI